jgi:hypothetical protein
MMNEILPAVYLTIAAASGVDPWAGLPGVMPNLRETSQPSVTIRGTEIGLALPYFEQIVIVSPWARRGRTFQERLFSKRLLVFTEQQIFFECHETSRSESNVTEVDAADQGMRYWFNSSYDDQKYDQVSKHVQGLWTELTLSGTILVPSANSN